MQSSRLFHITLGALTLDLSVRGGEVAPPKPGPETPAPDRSADR